MHADVGVKFEFPYPSGGYAVKPLVAKSSLSSSLFPSLSVFRSLSFSLDAIGQQAAVCGDQLIRTGESKVEKIFRE